jgi:hypothetical protein
MSGLGSLNQGKAGDEDLLGQHINGIPPGPGLDQKKRFPTSVELLVYKGKKARIG